jgi:hypothetical protein
METKKSRHAGPTPSHNIFNYSKRKAPWDFKGAGVVCGIRTWLRVFLTKPQETATFFYKKEKGRQKPALIK